MNCKYNDYSDYQTKQEKVFSGLSAARIYQLFFCHDNSVNMQDSVRQHPVTVLRACQHLTYCHRVTLQNVIQCIGAVDIHAVYCAAVMVTFSDYLRCPASAQQQQHQKQYQHSNSHLFPCFISINLLMLYSAAILLNSDLRAIIYSYTLICWASSSEWRL